MGRYRYWSRWPEYVPVAERRRQAQERAQRQVKKGQKLKPVVIEGSRIASTFWGKGWCDQMESFHDYSNRLPRGRSYVRHGCVVDLQIAPGQVTARVSGSRLYRVGVRISRLDAVKWKKLVDACAGKIDSLIELLQGRLSHKILEILTHRSEGMFPTSRQISFECNCPDWASMCKHVAATLYGVGARLGDQPELLFTLRRVNKDDLLTAGTRADALSAKSKGGKPRARLKEADLAGIFGIDLTEKT
jgi:uncharacterized Zn finger protein